MVWVAFGVGLFLGTFAGILVVGFCNMARKANPELYDEEYPCRCVCEERVL